MKSKRWSMIDTSDLTLYFNANGDNDVNWQDLKYT